MENELVLGSDLITHQEDHATELVKAHSLIFVGTLLLLLLGCCLGQFMSKDGIETYMDIKKLCFLLLLALSISLQGGKHGCGLWIVRMC